MSKHINNKLRKYIQKSVLILMLMVSSVIVMSCAGKKDISSNEKSVSENPSESDKIEGENDKEDEKTLDTENESNTDTTKEDLDNTVLNNGGLYVKYNGNVYYRRYTADSYSSDGIWGTYESIAGSKKDMICLKEDGTTKVAFRDTGNGNIFIYNNKMYLERYEEDYLSSVYSIDLDGKNEKHIGTGRIEGIDEEKGILVCTLVDESNTYQLYQLDCASGKLSKYDLEIPCIEVVSIKDGVVYYLGEVDFDKSQLGEIKLCSVAVDGKDQVLLVQTEPDLYEYGDRGTIVPCIQFVEDTIYFSYGAYGGTGNFYQGGKIARINKDGTDFAVLLGNELKKEDSKEDNSLEGFNMNFVGDIFYVAKEKDNTELYYSNLDYQNNYSLDLNTGKIAESDFPIYAEGIPFEFNGGVNMYLKASPHMTTLIPKVDYSFLKLEKDADYLTINDIEVCDGWVYYRLEANESNPEASIGWRDGYHRIKTTVVRQALKGQSAEALYEY